MQVSHRRFVITVSDNGQNSSHDQTTCRFGQRQQMDSSKYSQVIYYSDQAGFLAQSQPMPCCRGNETCSHCQSCRSGLKKRRPISW